MKQPNIVFIFSDQHNASVMGASNDPYIKTPNLDALASKGVKLNNCYCNSPLCVPSRMSILSGLYPLQAKAMNNFQALHSDIPTIAHAINIAGYETVLAGRMHFCGPDQNHGFEKRLVGDVTPNYHRDAAFQWVYEDYGDMMKQRAVSVKKAGAGRSSLYDFDAEVTEAAIDYMKDRDGNRPLFMTVGLFAPHPPYMSDPERFKYYYDLLPEIESSDDFKENLHPAMQDWLMRRKLLDVTSEQKRSMRAAYYALVEYLDDNIGKLVEGIEKTLGLENTIIVYASDHGESMGINDLYWKTTFYDSSVKVPAIISYPNNFMENVSLEAPTCLFDLTQSMISWAEAPKLPESHGMDLTCVLKGNEVINNNRTIISQIGNYPPAGDKPSAMIKKGDWKLVEYYGYDYPSLFNMTLDPEEVNDLGKDPSKKEIIDDLINELHEQWDPEQAYNYCNLAFEHFKLTKKWAETTKFEFPEVWKCQEGSNYLIKEE